MLGIIMKIRNSKMNKVTFAVTIALMPIVLSSSFSAFAAQENKETTKNKKNKDEIEVIEVTSFRDSIVSSLNTKRNANSVVDAISADDIASFPDSNVAESLQRIPGVSITRSLNGDGESVSIRGFSPGKNLSLVNGQQLTSSSFNLENALNRGYNYGLLPSTIVQRVEVHKSTEAYLPEGGVGGTVNVITRKPLSQRKELLFVATGEATYNTLSEDTGPKFSMLTSWKANDKFGALVSIDYSNQDSRRDAVEVLDYKKRTFTTDLGDTYSNVWVPQSLGFAHFNQTREKKTAMLTLQYQPSEALDMNFSYLSSDMEGNNLNTNLISLNTSNNYPAGTVADAKYDEISNTITRIEYNSARWATKPWHNPAIGQSSAIYRESALENDAMNFDIQWLGDNLTLKAAFGSSNSYGGGGDVTLGAIMVTGASMLSIEDGIGYAEYADDVTNLSDNKIWSYGGAKWNSTNENDFISFDGEYFFDDSVISSVQFGARYTETSQQQRQIVKMNDFAVATDDHVKYRNVVPAGELGELSSTPSDFLDGISDLGISDYQYLDPRKMYDLALKIDEVPHPANTFDIKEEITSMYMQANFEQEFGDSILRGNVGLRYSDQMTETKNLNATTALWNPVNWPEYIALDWSSVSNEDSNYLLPSVNLILDLQNDIVLRGAYSTVISRPAYSQLARQLVISPIDANDPNFETTGGRRVNKGNPDLEAFEADKFDLSAEWYYAEASSISLGLFYYDVKTYVTDEETIEDLRDDGEQWVVVQPVNKNGGSIAGLEAAISHQFTSLPAPFDGLGVQVNATVLDATSNDINPVTDSELPLAGLSELTYNAVLFYSKDKLDMRLSYNYRDNYYEEMRSGLPRFNEDIERLSAKVKYRVGNGLSVYLQGNNLTNQQNRRYLGDESRPWQTSEVGMNITAGFHYRF